jgi:hypothetical protein
MPQQGTTGALPPNDPHRTVRRSYDMQYHGTSEYRGGNCPTSRFYNQGRFGRLFPLLRSFNADPQALMQLGAKDGPMDGGRENPDHPDGLPSGFTFLGQFIDHDVTFDPTSSLERQADPEAIQNFRTPSLELDNVYGSGPGASPHLYRREDRSKLLIENDSGGGAETDLPRNSQGVALLGDPRNDENLIVSQLHVAFLRFHNAVAEFVRPNLSPRETLFEAAQRLVRWHYQWILIHEYLPAIVGQPMVDAVLRRRRFFKWRNDPFIPVEFSVAAFRFGHSQVRPGYRISAAFDGPIFPALGGGQRIGPERVIDWHRFFPLDPNDPPQAGKRFDPRISPALFDLPFAAGTPDDPKSLAQRNLMRGLTFGLPSGQDVAEAMREAHQEDVDASNGQLLPIEPLTPTDLSDVRELGFDEQTPLWYYILREAELRTGGKTLGPLGGRIVAETFVGLLQGDKLSYLSAAPRWKPVLGAGGNFRIADMLRTAGVVRPPRPEAPPANTTWQPPPP